MSSHALRLQGVSQSFGARAILRDLDLEVPGGTTLAVLGANGSGKTTLLRIAAGLREPSTGRAVLSDGTDAPSARRAGRIGYIPQHLGLVRHATVLQNACMGGLRDVPWWRTLLGRPSPEVRERARHALSVVALAQHGDALVREVSGGERQRVAIARTIVQKPDVVVADELVSSLDVRQARRVLQHLDALKAEGCAIVASMHDIPLALSWADRVAVLSPNGLWGPKPPTADLEEEIQCIVEG